MIGIVRPRPSLSAADLSLRATAVLYSWTYVFKDSTVTFETKGLGE